MNTRDSKQAQLLLALIEESFKDVRLEDGVSLHETIVIDNYGSKEERQLARSKDEKMDWRKLIHDPELLEVDGIGGLSFYDAKGLRFHLPAYLSVVIMDAGVSIAGALIFTLTSDGEYNRNRLDILNPGMKKCIGEVLQYFRTLPEFEFDQKKIDDALPYFLDAHS